MKSNHVEMKVMSNATQEGLTRLEVRVGYSLDGWVSWTPARPSRQITIMFGWGARRCNCESNLRMWKLALII